MPRVCADVPALGNVVLCLLFACVKVCAVVKVRAGRRRSDIGVSRTQRAMDANPQLPVMTSTHNRLTMCELSDGRQERNRKHTCRVFDGRPNWFTSTSGLENCVLMVVVSTVMMTKSLILFVVNGHVSRVGSHSVVDAVGILMCITVAIFFV